MYKELLAVVAALLPATTTLHGNGTVDRIYDLSQDFQLEVSLFSVLAVDCGKLKFKLFIPWNAKVEEMAENSEITKEEVELGLRVIFKCKENMQD